MIGSKLSIIPAPIKRGKDLKAVHAEQGISDDVFVYNKLTLPASNEAVQAFQSAIDSAYETLAQAIEEKLAPVLGEDQFSTMVELCKESVKGNPFPAGMQSASHKQNLTDNNTVTVWEVEKGSVTHSKENLAVGIELD